MASRNGRAEALPDEGESAAAAAAGSLYVPWQTLSALAAETGQAVKQTFTDSGVSTDGHVKQSLPQSYARRKHSQRAGSFEAYDFEPEEGLPDNIQLIDTQGLPKGLHAGYVDSDAVQAEINRVQRKMLSTDAATEVILRFNFMSGPESKVCWQYRIDLCLQPTKTMMDQTAAYMAMYAGCAAVGGWINHRGSGSFDS